MLTSCPSSSLVFISRVQLPLSDLVIPPCPLLHLQTSISPCLSSKAESPELSGQAVAALLKEPREKLMGRTGKIVLVSDVAREYGLREPDGTVPTDIRSFKTLLQMGGWYKLASVIPGFIRLPSFLFMYILGMGEPM